VQAGYEAVADAAWTAAAMIAVAVDGLARRARGARRRQLVPDVEPGFAEGRNLRHERRACAPELARMRTRLALCNSTKSLMVVITIGT
jgi:hypothetical protein